MGPIDLLFFYDYAVESKGKEFNKWFAGARNKIAYVLKHMTPL